MCIYYYFIGGNFGMYIGFIFFLRSYLNYCGKVLEFCYVYLKFCYILVVGLMEDRWFIVNFFVVGIRTGFRI